MQRNCLVLIFGLAACSLGHPLTGVFPQADGKSDSDLSAILFLGLAGAFGGLNVQVSAGQVLTYESVTFTAAGGTPPYSFRISRGGGAGNGTFQTSLNFASFDAPHSLQSGDFTNDGVLDLAVGTTNAGAQEIRIYAGNGNGLFQAGIAYTVTGANVSRAGAACDYNGDGRMDLALGDRANNVVAILFGDGAGSFAVGPQLAAPTDPHGVHCRDLNRDGIMDIAMASFGSDTLRVFPGN